jgi:hypothetical protein
MGRGLVTMIALDKGVKQGEAAEFTDELVDMVYQAIDENRLITARLSAIQQLSPDIIVAQHYLNSHQRESRVKVRVGDFCMGYMVVSSKRLDEKSEPFVYYIKIPASQPKPDRTS